MKKTLITVAITAICFGITACGNVEVSSSAKSETTTTTSAVVTTAPEQSATVAQSDVDATTTSLPQTTVTTTAPVVTTTPEQVTTTTAATTKATEKKTTTTTRKVTTTTKKATTTAKPKPVTTTKKVTTTTKKATTTAPKTTTKKVTTTTKPTAKLTQSDVDKLVKELQAYSNSKETDVRNNLATVYNYFGGLCKTPEDYYKLHIADATPSNSSWDFPTDIYPDETYAEAKAFLKEEIDYQYRDTPNAHIVIYANWCPNGEGNTNPYATKDGWEIYMLR